MKSRGRIGISAICVTLAFSLAANAQTRFKSYQPGDWAKIVAAAKAEGKAVLYASMTPPVLQEFKSKFEAAYPGIQLEFSRQQAGQLPIVIDQERRSNADGGDVIITTEVPWMLQRLQQNFFRAPIGPASTSWPDSYVLGNMAPVILEAPLVLLYNTNIVKSKLTGYADLLNPEYKGKMAVVEPSADAIVAFYEWLTQTQGNDFLPKLAAQNPLTYPSAVPITQATISGEVAVAEFSTSTVAGPFVRDGAPIKIVVPAPSVGTPWAASVLASAKRPNAGLVVLDFIMSAVAQTIFAGQGDAASPIGVPGSLDIKNTTVLDQTKYTPERVAEYRAKWSNIFRKQ